jgi:hypothetical protein
MNQTATSDGILIPDLFNEYAAQWLNKISEQDNPDLPGYFQDKSGDRMSYLQFPIQRVIELVSAVGVRYVKARFVLLPGATPNEYLFSLVLFAADEDHRQLTAYYLPDAAAGQGAGVPNEPVPSGLSDVWKAAWQDASPLTTAMFSTSYGPLEGYNFDVKDFLAPLFIGSDPYATQQVRLLLGLRGYVDPAGTPTQTFGLVVRLADANAGAKVQAGNDGYYDMSTPCPPVI